MCVCVCMYITVKGISAARCEQCFHCRQLAKKNPEKLAFPQNIYPFYIFYIVTKSTLAFLTVSLQQLVHNTLFVSY